MRERKRSERLVLIGALNALQKRIHGDMKGAGFYDSGPRSPGEFLALAHSELSEALEAYREGNGDPGDFWINEETGKPEGFMVELADCVIRCLDTAEYYGVSLGHLIEEKLEYNRGRPYRHGGKLL